MILTAAILAGIVVLVVAGTVYFSRRKRTIEPSLDGPIFWQNLSPMWIFDLETLKFIAVNDAATRRYGYSRDEFHKMTLREGVETTDQLEFLTALGCDRWQGYLFSEARPAADIPRLIRSRENPSVSLSAARIG